MPSHRIRLGATSSVTLINLQDHEGHEAVVWSVLPGHRSLESMRGATLPPSLETVHFPSGQRAHSRHAQSERENDSALFPLVILGLLSALSVLILGLALCWAAPFIWIQPLTMKTSPLFQAGHKHTESNNNNDGGRKVYV